MNVYKNAGMTVPGRALLVNRVTMEGWRVADAAAAAGISLRTAYNWLARFRAGGERMLEDRSSAPAPFCASRKLDYAVTGESLVGVSIALRSISSS